MSRRNSGVQLTGHFIGQSHSLARQVGSLQGKTCRESLRHILTSHYVANVMAIVVLIDTVCTCSAIDARADGGRDPSFAVLFISDACLALYTLELLLLLSVTGSQILRDWMMLMDALIVACGWAEIILLQVIPQDILGFRIKVLRVLRLMRIFRPIRLLKRIRGLRELYKLASMMATCFRTLIWCFLLCFVVMTGWAMLMVEIVYPAVQDMHENHGFFTDCEQCQRAMSSVMDANLLLFKTVIAGDSWGEIAVPVIQEHPWTSVIFVGSMLTLVFGVVNLIVAVVIDTFADSRQNDVQNLAEELEDEIEHDRTALAKLFKRIDKDGSGQLTLEELIQGARHDRAFQSRLRVMDIDENDLQQLFHMIDIDESGTIEVSEFIGPLSRWAHDSKTAPRFIKYNMLQTMHLQQDLYDLSVDCFNHLSSRIDDVAHQICVVHGQSEAGEAKPDSKFQEAKYDDDLAKVLEASTAFPEPKPVSPVPCVSFQSELVSKPCEQFELTDFCIEAALLKIEVKLDALLAESREARAKTRTLGGLGRMQSQSFRSSPVESSLVQERRDVSRMRRLDTTAFRSLYMRSASMRSLAANREGSEANEGEESLAANSFSMAASQSGWSGWNGWPLRKSNPKASIPVSQSRVQTVDVQAVRSVRSEVIDEDTIENSQI